MSSTPRLLPWQRTVAVAVPPLVVLVFVYLLGVTIERRRESTDRVERAQETIGQVHELRARVMEAETGQRGYLITGDSSYLAPYLGAAERVATLVDSLWATDRYRGRHAASLAELEPLILRRFAIFELPIQAYDRDGFAAGRAAMVEGPARETMSRIGRILDDIEQAEQLDLAAATVIDARTRRLLLWVLALGAAITGTVALLTNRWFAGHAHAAESWNGELRTANVRLRDQALMLERQAKELQGRQGELEVKTRALETSNAELQEYRAHLETSARELASSNSELLRVNRLLEERTAEAETSNRAKTDFLTAMSHELRTPLNAITGYVDLMELGVYGSLTTEQASGLTRIRYNSRHLLTLITDILNFAKIAAGRVEVRIRDALLDDLLHEVESVMRPLFEAKTIRFSTGGADRALHLHVDPDRTRQILLNLLTNAMKYTESGGTVEVFTDADAERVRIHVKDTGKGIPPELQQAIFDPFVQVARGPGSSLVDGVGLGLAISRELAQAMDGQLTVESSVGVGSTFTLSLRRTKLSVAA